MPNRAAARDERRPIGKYLAALGVYYILESKKAVNWDFAKAPTFVATT